MLLQPNQHAPGFEAWHRVRVRQGHRRAHSVLQVQWVLVLAQGLGW